MICPYKILAKLFDPGWKTLNLSLDQLLNVKSGSILFQDVRIQNKDYTYKQYLEDLLRQVQGINNYMQREIIYLSKDLPIFHNFYYKPLIAFRYFFWMKTILLHPDFANSHFSLECLLRRQKQVFN